MLLLGSRSMLLIHVVIHLWSLLMLFRKFRFPELRFSDVKCVLTQNYCMCIFLGAFMCECVGCVCLCLCVCVCVCVCVLFYSKTKNTE